MQDKEGIIRQGKQPKLLLNNIMIGVCINITIITYLLIITEWIFNQYFNFLLSRRTTVAAEEKRLHIMNQLMINEDSRTKT